MEESHTIELGPEWLIWGTIKIKGVTWSFEVNT